MRPRDLLCCNGGRIRVSVNQDETVVTTIDDEGAKSVVSMSPSDVYALISALHEAAAYALANARVLAQEVDRG